jgi:hypothetical protein
MFNPRAATRLRGGGWRSPWRVVSAEPSDRPWMAYAGVFDGSEGDSASVDEVVYGREAP